MSEYSPTVWVPGGAPAINAANLNKAEAGIANAHSELHAHTHSGGADDAPAIPWANISEKPELFPWLVQIIPFLAPAAQTSFATVTQDGTYLLAGYRTNAGAYPASIGWDVLLGAGVWSVSLICAKGTAYGIYTVKLDGTTVGSLDAYYSSTVTNATLTLSGVSVVSPGLKRLTLEVSTKNPASTGYNARFQLVHLLRTS